MFIQITKGLKALHDHKVFHRDLKSANIFLNKDGHVTLGDMNVSKVAKKGLLYTQTGSSLPPIFIPFYYAIVCDSLLLVYCWLVSISWHFS